MTYDEAIIALSDAAANVADALEVLEAAVPSQRLRVLHNRANALAVFAEDVLARPRGTFHGVIHPDAGTDKPDPNP